MKSMMLLSVLFAFNAQASYMATHCTNALGTVKWETGHNENMMTVQTYKDPSGSVSFRPYDVNIVFSNEVILKEVATNNCYVSTYMKVKAAKATITPSEQNPTVLDFVDGAEKKIEAEVICQEDFNSRSYCPPTETDPDPEPVETITE